MAPETDHAPFGLFFVIREMGQVKVYSCTKLKVSSFTDYTFAEGVLKCNKSASGPWPRPLCGYFITHEMGLSKIYVGTKFEISSFTFSKDTAQVPCNGWMREGCTQTNVRISVVF